MAWLWWAPLVSAVLHIMEEFVYPGGFAAWDRTYRPAIRTSITPRFHVIINGVLLLACLQVALLGKTDDLKVYPIGVAAWLTLSALLFSNAVFHVIGTWQSGKYSPGVVTGVAAYMPLTLFGYWYFLHNAQASGLTAVFAVVVGGSYHLWAALMHRARARRALG